MKREKTALDVTVSGKEKQDTYPKLMREPTVELQHEQESEHKQESQKMLEERVSTPLLTKQWFKRIQIATWILLLLRLGGQQSIHEIYI